MPNSVAGGTDKVLKDAGELDQAPPYHVMCYRADHKRVSPATGGARAGRGIAGAVRSPMTNRELWGVARVLAEALTALAAAGGTAVVQAAGNDAWAGFRSRVAKWFGRGDAGRERVALERLDRTAAALEAAGPGEVERVRAGQQASWQTMFEILLEDLDEEEQQQAADELRDLLDNVAGGWAAAVGQGAVAVAGDVDIRAETGGAAAWQMGDVQIGHLPGGPAGAPVGPSPAGAVSRLTAPGTPDHVAPPDREVRPGAPGVSQGSWGAHAESGGVAAYSIGAVNVGPGRLAVRSAYRKQVGRIAPPELVGREAELRELAAYCTEPGRGPYVWWQAPAWAGKSALMSTFVLHPPAGVRVVAFFITARLGAQDTREAFTEVVLEQLAELLEQELPSLTAATRDAHLLRMLEQAAEACATQGERLILMVDGLDEDRGVTTGPDAHSIAALLPTDPPAGMRVVVAGRPDPPIPDDVPGWHRLRDPGIVRLLASSAYAQDIKALARQELWRLLRGTPAPAGSTRAADCCPGRAQRPRSSRSDWRTTLGDRGPPARGVRAYLHTAGEHVATRGRPRGVPAGA